MWRRRNCGCRPKCGRQIGASLISLGLGIFLAHIIPYYLLITLLGVALIALGIWNLMGKWPSYMRKGVCSYANCCCQSPQNVERNPQTDVQNESGTLTQKEHPKRVLFLCFTAINRWCWEEMNGRECNTSYSYFPDGKRFSFACVNATFGRAKVAFAQTKRIRNPCGW